jgi:hypothetical protein
MKMCLYESQDDDSMTNLCVKLTFESHDRVKERA